MKVKLGIVPALLLSEYILNVTDSLEKNFGNLSDSELSTSTFSFYTSVSAVFSSKIEGESIDMDSYIKHKRFGAHFLPTTHGRLMIYMTLIYLPGKMILRENH